MLTISGAQEEGRVEVKSCAGHCIHVQNHNSTQRRAQTVNSSVSRALLTFGILRRPTWLGLLTQVQWELCSAVRAAPSLSLIRHRLGALHSLHLIVLRKDKEKQASEHKPTS